MDLTSVELEILKAGRIAVTGAAGFIGTNLVLRLLEMGCRVRAVVHRRLLQFEHPLLEVVPANLLEPEDCRSAISGCPAVVHAAADGGGFAANLGRDYQLFTHNLGMSLNLLAAIMRDGHVDRYVYVSSSAVYGTPSDLELHEDDAGPPFLPSEHGFAWAKWAAEEQVRMAVAAGLRHGVIVRPTNPYGPWDALDVAHAHFIPSVILRLMRSDRGTLALQGNGAVHRNFTAVADLVSGLLLALVRGTSGQAYNLGAPQNYTLMDVVERLRRLLGREDVEVCFDPTAPTGHPGRRPSQTRSRADLGFSRHCDLDSGLEATTAWYRRHTG